MFEQNIGFKRHTLQPLMPLGGPQIIRKHTLQPSVTSRELPHSPSNQSNSIKPMAFPPRETLHLYLHALLLIHANIAAIKVGEEISRSVERMGVWKELEEKWRSSPQDVVLLAICAAVVIVGVCATVLLRKRRVTSNGQQQQVMDKEPCCMVKPNLMSSILGCWRSSAEQQQGAAMPTTSTVEGGGCRESPATSPVWQRRIMMGERCEMPRYSGLILYDERGRPVGSCNPYHPFFSSQVKKVGAVSSPATTTLRDLV